MLQVIVTKFVPLRQTNMFATYSISNYKDILAFSRYIILTMYLDIIVYI